MGLVKLTEEVTNEWEDLHGIYPYVRATLYVYCDECGSFSIKPRPGFRRILLVMVSCLIIVGGILAASKLQHGMYWLWLCLVTCILAFRYFWGHPNYICRTCGSPVATHYNILHFPSDTPNLNIPDQFRQKLYFEYFPDWYNLDNSLESPETQLIAGNNAYQFVLSDLDMMKGVLRFILTLLFVPLLPLLAIIFLVGTQVIPRLRSFLSSKRGGEFSK